MRTIITSMYTYMYLTVMIICILVCLPSVIYSIYILVMIIVYYLVMIFIDKAQCKKKYNVFNAPPLIYSPSGSGSKISVLLRLIRTLLCGRPIVILLSIHPSLHLLSDIKFKCYDHIFRPMIV